MKQLRTIYICAFNKKTLKKKWTGYYLWKAKGRNPFEITIQIKVNLHPIILLTEI